MCLFKINSAAGVRVAKSDLGMFRGCTTINTQSKTCVTCEFEGMPDDARSAAAAPHGLILALQPPPTPPPHPLPLVLTTPDDSNDYTQFEDLGVEDAEERVRASQAFVIIGILVGTLSAVASAALMINLGPPNLAWLVAIASGTFACW